MPLKTRTLSIGFNVLGKTWLDYAASMNLASFEEARDRIPKTGHKDSERICTELNPETSMLSSHEPNIFQKGFHPLVEVAT